MLKNVPLDEALESFLPAASQSEKLPLISHDELVDILANAANSELAPLVEYLVKRGSWTCQLKKLAVYKSNFPKHRAYSRDIAAEIQKYGGNTIVNGVRRAGRGVPYSEIVHDVARYLKLEPKGFTKETEVAIREHLLTEYWKGLNPKERQQLLDDFAINGVGLAARAAIPPALIMAATMTGFGSYKASVILANAFARAILGHGLNLTANALITKGLSIFLGPVGWSLAASYSAKLISSEAYRVTIPCVLQVSMIREANAQRVLNAKSRQHRRALKIASVIAAFTLLVGVIWSLLGH